MTSMDPHPATAAWDRVDQERERAVPYRPWVTIVLAFIVALLPAYVFWDCTSNGFVNWDDDRNFLHNESYRGIGLEQARWAWRTYHLGVWQPAAWLLLGAQYEWFGLEPRGYHIASVVLHALTGAALFLVTLALLRAWGPRGTSPAHLRAAAALAAIAFAVHPLRVEAVAWASCQPYLPAALFFLLAVGAYLKAWGEITPGRRAAWVAACLASYMAAVMFKAVAVTLPAVLVILDVLLSRRAIAFERRPAWWVLLVEKLPFVAVAMAVSIWAAQAKDFNESRAPLMEFDPPARLANASYALCNGVARTVVPKRLTPYDRLPPDISLMQMPYAACAGAVLFVTAYCTWRARRRPELLAAWLAYVVILLPNAGLIQISQQLTADRYAYLATMPLFVLLGAGLAGLPRWPQFSRLADGAAWLALLAASAALVTLTQRQIAIWRDGEALWSRALELDPASAVAACNLGEAFIQSATPDEAMPKFEAGERMLRRAIDLEPAMSFAWSNLGVVQFLRGEAAAAVESLERALVSDPPLKGLDAARTHAALGAAYAGLRKDDLAWRHTLIARDKGFAPAQKMIDYLSQFSRPPATQNVD